MKIVLVTSCLAGVAQSKMAAKALRKEAESRGFAISVEEQGGHKIPRRLNEQEINDAEVVIFATAVAISGRNRFQGKKILELPVARAIKDPGGIIDQAVTLRQVEPEDSGK